MAQVPALTNGVIIPRDVTPERVTTQIIDSSLRVQTEEQIAEEMRKADVLCAVYSVQDQASFDRISSYWLPMMRGKLEMVDAGKRPSGAIAA